MNLYQDEKSSKKEFCISNPTTKPMELTSNLTDKFTMNVEYNSWKLIENFR